MSIVTVEKNTYTVEALYQWDIGQILEIRGLSLASVPEIHFTNDAMDRAIVRQARMDAAGVVFADIPDSLLQKPYRITAYVCTYEGATFETLYKIVIPVNARQKPNDYTIEDGEEIYSFNALENAVVNALAAIDTAGNKAEENATAAEENARAAAISESNAVTAAGNAATSATAAATSAGNAAASETNAANSKKAAATSASNAATSEGNAAASAEAAAASAKACEHKCYAVTLTAAGWSSYAQTAAVDGLDADHTIIVCPAPTSQDAYYAAGVKAMSQGAGSIVFNCTAAPTADLVVNVLDMGVPA